MPTSSRTNKQAPSAAFVFKGTLKKLHSATMPMVSVDEQTAIVRVDEILAAPDAFESYTGHEITVRLSQEGSYRPGQQLIFYTNSWLYGDSIAVQSVKEEPVGGASTARHKAAGEALKTRLTASQPEHFEDADLVVRGKVMAVRLPPDARQSGSEKAGGLPGPISEHSPDWREAVINVTDVLKGESADKQIVVRFPFSTDIRWHQVPKFEPGQEGYFLLHHAEAGEAENKPANRKAKSKTASPPADPAAYTVLHAEDFQP